MKKIILSLFLLLYASFAYAGLWGNSGGGTVYLADCSTIKTGFCVDTSDGSIWYWNGSAVVASGGSGDYTLPTASGSTLGGVKVGTGLDIAAGVLSLDATSNPTFGNVTATGGTITAGVGGSTQGALVLKSNTDPIFTFGLMPAASPTAIVGIKAPAGMPTANNSLWTVDIDGQSEWTDPASITGSGDDLGSAAYSDVVALWTTCTGYLKSDGTCSTPSGTVPDGTINGQVLQWATDQWVAAALGTAAAYNVGTGNNNIVQLNGSGQLPFTIDLMDLTSGGTAISPPGTAGHVLTANTSGVITWAAPGAADLMDLTSGGTAINPPGTSGYVLTASDTGVITWAAPGSGGYTNLTDFDGQSNWQMFYSNGSGDVTELALGANGKVLKSNGASAAPTWEDDATAAGAGYVSTPPTYSDEACTAGQYSLAEAYRYDCVASGNWNRTALTDWSNPAPTVPTLTARVIGTNGTSLTLTGSASLSVGAGGNGGFDVDCSTAGNGITATYASGAPGTDLVYTLGTTVNSGDTCDLDYTQPGNGIEATTGGADLASITSGAITNNSTQSSGEGATCSGYTVCQNFEGTGYDNSETWTTSGTLDPDSTSSPLRGSQSLLVQPGAYAYRNITAMTGAVSIHAMIKLSSITADLGQAVISGNNGGDSKFSVVLAGAGGGILTAYHGAVGLETAAGTVAADTVYHIWIDFVRGTGTNGTLDLYVSTTSTKPGSPAASITNGTGYNEDINRIGLWSLGSTRVTTFDYVLVKDSNIGTVVN